MNLRLRGDRESGLLSISWDELAFLVMCDASEARGIVEAMTATTPPLVNARSLDEIGATLVFPEWERWHLAPKDLTAAERKAEQRAREAALRAAEAAASPKSTIEPDG